jgi:hypothetical protein
MDEWKKWLQVSTVKSIFLVKNQFRNCKCREFHEFILRNRKISEEIHSSAKHISAPTLPTAMDEVHFFKGKYQSVRPRGIITGKSTRGPLRVLISEEPQIFL